VAPNFLSPYETHETQIRLPRRGNDAISLRISYIKVSSFSRRTCAPRPVRVSTND
jgi:hypothetical protein